jgi:hypothetical protein
MANSQQLTALRLFQKRTKKRHPKTKLPVFGEEYVLSCVTTVVNYSISLFTLQPEKRGNKLKRLKQNENEFPKQLAQREA